MQSEFTARLCTLQKWENFVGYGFSLIATQGKAGHYISEVDENSPAYCAGLRDNDFVVEVNGVNVLSHNHSEVVQHVRSNPTCVTFLVVDTETKKYFDSEQITIDCNMTQLKAIDCPSEPPDKPSMLHNGTNSCQLEPPLQQTSMSASTSSPPSGHIPCESSDQFSSGTSSAALPSSMAASIVAKPSSPSEVEYLTKNVSVREMRERVSKYSQRNQIKDTADSFGARTAIFDQM